MARPKKAKAVEKVTENIAVEIPAVEAPKPEVTPGLRELKTLQKFPGTPGA